MKKIIYYLPRISALSIILLFGVFILEGLGDGFNRGDLLMNSLFVLVMVGVTALAWKYPNIGGWIFVIGGFLLGLILRPWPWSGLIIGGVIMISGVLFLLEYFKGKKEKKVQKTILLLIIGLIFISIIGYLAVFGRALKQDENHFNIFLALPRVIMNSEAVSIGDGKYLAKDIDSFTKAVEQEGFTYSEQMGSALIFEKGGLNYFSKEEMYSSRFMIFTYPQQSGQTEDSTSLKQLIATASFVCDSNRTIEAEFYDGESQVATSSNQPPIPGGSVKLTFAGGTTIDLPQTISADGARYANADESFVFWNKGDGAFIEENGEFTFSNCEMKDDSQTENTGLANPASVNCSKQGGQIVIQTKPDGGQYGLCFFDDNRACEEWAMLRGECPVGGRKTTGYDTEAQKFCAWSGGQTIAEDNAVCTFSDGSVCPDDAFYAGTCQKGIKTDQNQKLPSGYTLDNYTVAKILNTACQADTDCDTPAEYLLRSNCPYTSLCLDNKCVVVCPGQQD